MFFAGLKAVAGDRFQADMAILVRIEDDELAGMIERIIDAAGIERMEVTQPSPVVEAPVEEKPVTVSFGIEPAESGQVVPLAATVLNEEEIVEQSMESQANGKRPRKNWVQDAEGKEIVGVNGAKDAPAVEGVNKCQICGKPLSSKRAKLCESKECKRKWNANYQKAYYRKAHAGTAPVELAAPEELDTKESPSDADLQEVEAFEQVLAEEMAADGLLAAEGLPTAEFVSKIDGLPEPVLNEPNYGDEPALPVEEAAAAEEAAAEAAAAEAADRSSWAWLVEDGPRKGSRMTNKQIVRLLMHGNLRVGQHIRHERLGQCEVVKGKPPMQKLKQLYGNGAPRFILPAEISAGN